MGWLAFIAVVYRSAMGFNAAPVRESPCDLTMPASVVATSASDLLTALVLFTEPSG